MASTDVDVIRLTSAHTDAVLALYLAVAADGASGLARQPHEIDRKYVRAFLEKVDANGLSLGLCEPRSPDRLLGELHATRMGPAQFNHVLTDLTIAIDPRQQGRGLGSTLFRAYFDTVRRNLPEIRRIELLVRSGHAHARRLYERLGFVQEGCMIGRVQLADGSVEDDIPMALTLDRVP
jgi:RimJ/RimL family protein N-acetyltransferase